MNKLTLVFINHLKSGGAKIKKIAHGLLFSTTTTTTTSIHATDPLLVPTTPYYAHLYPLLPRARGALQDLDRTPQEPGHYNDYHDTTTGIHATDQLLVSTTPYYAHLYPLLLRARGALQDLDRNQPR